MRTKLITQRDFRLEAHHMEKILGPSMTVPDESYGVREIMEKFTTGLQPPGIMREGKFDPAADHDSDDLEKLKDLDLVERQQYSENLAQKMLASEEVIKKTKAEKAEKLALERSEQEELRKELRARKAAKDAPKSDLSKKSSEEA